MLDRLFDFLISCLRFFQFCRIINAYEGGVILRNGIFHRLAKPGFQWYIPFKIEEIILTSVVPEPMNVGPQSLTTKDDTQIIISTVVTFAIDDVKSFLLDVSGADGVVEDSAYGAIAQYILNHTYTELMTVDLSNELTKIVRRNAKPYGVNIIRVQLSDFTKSRSYRLVQAAPVYRMGPM